MKGEVSPSLQSLRLFRYPLCGGSAPQRPAVLSGFAGQLGSFAYGKTPGINCVEFLQRKNSEAIRQSRVARPPAPPAKPGYFLPIISRNSEKRTKTRQPPTPRALSPP
jgi:hypothetical protein